MTLPTMYVAIVTSKIVDGHVVELGLQRNHRLYSTPGMARGVVTRNHARKGQVGVGHVRAVNIETCPIVGMASEPLADRLVEAERMMLAWGVEFERLTKLAKGDVGTPGALFGAKR